ncbi:MAG: hypothetical protein IJH12_08030 [Clostridia bacterium]|nr:hypothetical protein [Clostridia bacterium]
MADVLKSAVLASQWWSEKILDTTNIENFNVGESGNVGAMISVLGALNATFCTPTPEAAVAFRIALQQIIMRELNNNPENPVLLSCDYFPNTLLQEAADKAGIDTSAFPFKRTMRVFVDHVYVSDGCEDFDLMEHKHIKTSCVD